MRALIATTLLLMLSTSGAHAAPRAEFFRMTVERLADDAYYDRVSRVVVVTRYCYEYTYGDQVILEYERGSYNNRLIFKGGAECDVAGIYRPNAELTRVAQDLYRDTSTRKVLKTQYCYAYAYSENALILEDRVIFVDSREACDISWY